MKPRFDSPFLHKEAVMALVNTKKMFDEAMRGGFAIGAFNVNNMELLQGILWACKEKQAPSSSRSARARASTPTCAISAP